MAHRTRLRVALFLAVGMTTTGLAVLAYDIQFSEFTPKRRGIIQDNAFMDASRAAGNLVFSTTEVNDKGAGKFLGGAQGLAYARAQLGNGNFDTDPGGVIRRAPFELQGLKSFSVAAAERATGKAVHPFSGDTKLIDFAGPVGTIPAVSFSHVYNGTFPRG